MAVTHGHRWSNMLKDKIVFPTVLKAELSKTRSWHRVKGRGQKKVGGASSFLRALVGRL